MTTYRDHSHAEDVGHDEHRLRPSGRPAAEELLEEAIQLVADTRAMPMSSTIKVSKDELLDLLEAARDELPRDLYAAQELLRQRDDFIAAARQEREDLIEQGRIQVSRMVERQEIVRSADLRARQIVEEARSEAAELRTQVEDYCDQKLASFEVMLDKTARTVQQGREKLLGGTRLVPPGPPPQSAQPHGEQPPQPPLDLRDQGEVLPQQRSQPPAPQGRVQ